MDRGGAGLGKRWFSLTTKEKSLWGKHFLFCKNLSRSYSSGKVMDRGEAGLEKRWFSLTTKEKSLWADIFYFCYFGIVLTDFNCRGSNFNLTSFSIVILFIDKTLFLLMNELIGSLWECTLCFAGMLAKHGKITLWGAGGFQLHRRSLNWTISMSWFAN